jgi:signal transduction histidine kinase
MTREFLKQVSLFHNLSEGDFEMICGMVEEVHLAPGEELFAEGSPGDRAYIIESGELEIYKESEGREMLLAARGKGEVIGEMSLLENMPRTASVRASLPTALLALSQDRFDLLLDTSPTAARQMLNIVLTRWRNTQIMLQQREQLAQLGTLTAGVAHELNNPAAAAKRGSSQLEEALDEMSRAYSRLSGLALSQAQLALIDKYAERAREAAPHPPRLDTLTRSDREYELENWLEGRGIEQGWEYAPVLVNLSLAPGDLGPVTATFSPGDLPVFLDWLCAFYTVRSLLGEIGEGVSRISAIVKALKTYSYLDQAPVQDVDVHEGLDNTLVILHHKLTDEITVRRDYDLGLPHVEAYGSELNQVWTNILDNAIDALDGEGQITIRTRQEAGSVVVEIEDNGPGIPPEVLPRIFDPFFTTKPVGSGTGLGLAISYNNVVVRHRGDIQVRSQPGQTVFEVHLPIASPGDGASSASDQEQESGS